MSEDAVGLGKLLAARDRIQAIFKEYDIAGVCFVHTPGFVEVFSDYSPSYSRLTVREIDHALEVRLRSKLVDYGGDKQAQRRDLDATANMTSSLSEVMSISAMQLMDIAKMVDEKLGSIHTPLQPVDIPKGSVQ